MLLAPRPSSTTASLLRLVAAWLVLVLLFEGFAVVRGRAAGPLHRHSEASTLLVQHQPTVADADVHVHAHRDAERHHHAGAAADASTPLLDDEAAALEAALDAASAALAAVFALLALMAAMHLAGHAGQVFRPALPWPWLTAATQPALRPPRLR